MDSYKVVIRLFIFSLVLNNTIDFANGEDATTDVNDGVYSTTKAPTKITTTLSSEINTTTKPKMVTKPPKKKVESIETPMAYQIPIVRDRIILNVTALEINVDLTIIILKTGSSYGKFGETSLSQSQQLLIGLETEHFNVDVISLSFINDTKSGLGFSNKIEDFGWNKRSGILIPDNINHYKWIASEQLKNGSGFFVTFQRKWQTCDTQDIQFGFSSIQVWWLLDTEFQDRTKIDRKPMAQMSEKQQNPRTLRPATSESSIRENEIPQLRNKTLKLDKDDAVQRNNSVQVSPEVEILKSIQDSNFQGPVKININDWTKNVTTFFIKSCGQSNVVFRCSGSDLRQLSATNNSDLLLVSIWKVNLQSSSASKIPGHKIEPCKVLIDYLYDGNSKMFDALFGKHGKNGESSFTPVLACITMIVNVFYLMY